MQEGYPFTGTTMDYFQPGHESVATQAERIACGLLDSIGARLSGGGVPDDKAVHEIRKTCKRMRALLRLLQPALREHAFREADRKVRKLAVRLGQARDQAVMLATIERVAQHYAPVLDAGVFTPVRSWLSQAAEPAALVPEPASLCLTLDDLRCTWAALDLQDAATDTLVRGVTASYRRGRHALRTVQQQPDAEPVHALRRHTKYLFNQLTMLSALDPQAIDPLVELSHDTEEALGEVHDLAVLADAAGHGAMLRDDPLRREVLTSLLETRWIRQLSTALRSTTLLYTRKTGQFRSWLAPRLNTA